MYIKTTAEHGLQRNVKLHMDPTFPLVPFANFVAFLLIMLSLSKNMFRIYNVGTCFLAFWIATKGLTTAIWTIVWSNNVNNLAPVWCDIGVSIFLSVHVEL